MSVQRQQRVVLTGFMGAGKSTVAAALARRLNCRAIDLDEIISQHERQSVPALIDGAGEAHFRATETRVLRVVLENKTASIIALGGGAWTLERNRALLQEHDCLTVWLDAPFELCWHRIISAKDERPLARDHGSAHKLYDERRPLYELAALHVSVNEDKSADDVALEIIQALQRG
ncbi:MAG TPA: shikimate kinase [Pyrinomonadaceae bacterium]|jgi:shikimate kinase